MHMRMRLETGLSLSLAAGTHPTIDREIARSFSHVRVLVAPYVIDRVHWTTLYACSKEIYLHLLRAATLYQPAALHAISAHGSSNGK